MRHPQEDDKRLFLPLKMNLAPQAALGLEFRIKAGRIEWGQGPSTLKAESVIAAERWGNDSLHADHWLLEFLANGPQPAKEVIEAGRELGFSERTLRRAKAALGVRADRHGFKKGESHFTWSLNDNTGDGAIANVAAYGK